jgi:transposase
MRQNQILMQHKQGESRNQIFMFSLESSISANSIVRVLDAFVDAIDLKSFGFAHFQCHQEGRPPYHPSVLLKLYLYGYHYGIRSTRKLEREAHSNIEAMWLLSGLRPKYKTIADFRKNHSKAFREVFRRFVSLLKEWKLVEGETVAIDSFKIRGSNSLKNNFNQAKLKRHLDYIDNQIAEYEALLDFNDTIEEKKELKEKIAERNKKKAKYEQIKSDLEKSGEEQISLTDADSRSVILHKNIINVGYNVQASIDAKHKLLVEYDTGQVNDTHALASMSLRSKEILGVEKMKVLADKGYHTGEQLEECERNEIIPYVSPKAPSTKDIGLYPITRFVYNKENDHYICPQGQILKTNGRWHQHSNSRKNDKGGYKFKRYNSPVCKTCAFSHLCTQSQKNVRNIDRSQYADSIEANAKRIENNPEYYRQRQQIAEHPFGTLKRQRGFTHTLVRGKDKVLGEVGLMFIGYNLSRCISILGVDKLIKLLTDNCLHILKHEKRLILSLYKDLIFSALKNAA